MMHELVSLVSTHALISQLLNTFYINAPLYFFSILHLSCSEADLGMKTNTFKNLECWNVIEIMSVVLILEEKTDVSKRDEK